LLAEERKKTEIYRRDIDEEFTTQLLPIIQNLTGLGYSERDIGSVIGFAGQLTNDWLESLQKERDDVAGAIKTGRMLAKGALIAKLVQTSLGYSYEEVDEYWVPHQEKGKQKSWVLTKKTIHKRHQAASVPAMLSIASKLLPDVFVDDKEKSGDEVSAEQIDKLVGKLSAIVENKQCPVILGEDSKTDSGEHPVSQRPASDVGEGQVGAESNAAVDTGKATDSV